jgi:hypothetical protein
VYEGNIISASLPADYCNPFLDDDIAGCNYYGTSTCSFSGWFFPSNPTDEGAEEKVQDSAHGNVCT